MYRLKFRKSAAGIGALIFGAVAMIAIPLFPTTNDKGLLFDLPLAAVGAAQFLLPLLFSLVTYRSCPFIQQLRAFLVTSSFMGFFGMLANAGPPLQAFQVNSSEMLLHLNAVSLGAMNLASLIAATNLMQAEQMSSFADTQVAEAQLERLKAVKVDPDTQAKWEKAAAYADRSTDGRSLRSTMTNLKAISLAEPGQELKPTPREAAEISSREKSSSAPASAGGDDGSLANVLDRMDDEPLTPDGGNLSAAQSKNSALAGNSFINDATETEPVDTGAGFLDSILNSKIQEEDAVSAAIADLDAPATDVGLPATDVGLPATDLGLPEIDTETTDVAALLDSFGDAEEPAGSDMLEPEPAAALFEKEESYAGDTGYGSDEAPADLLSKLGGIDDEDDSAQADAGAAIVEPVGEDKFEAKPTATKQVDSTKADGATETTRSTSFANASSSRNSLPALQPLHEGASAEVTALSGEDTGNFPVPSATPTSTAGAPTGLSPTNTNNKLAAMKRRNTSTFTKLNALSASGTGTLKPQQPDVESEPDSLRSLLDRLDDEPAEEAPKKVEEVAKPIEPPTELTLDTVFKGDGAPEVAATPKTVAVKPAEEAKAKVAEVKEEPAAIVEPEAKAAAEPEPELEPEPVKADSGFRGARDLDAPPDLNINAGDFEASPLSSLLDRSLGESDDAPEAADGEVEEPSEPLFGGGVDGEIDDIFSELAPPEAQKEVADVFPSSTARSGINKESPEPNKVEAAPAAKEAVSEALAEVEEEAQGSLFNESLDSEIDDIFSELAPADAHKEVKDVLPATKPAAASASSTAAKAAPEPADEPAEATEGGGEGGLFGESLGEELDNIFSGLTESAQLDVTPGALARYKGDDDLLEPEPKVEAPKPAPAAEKAPAAASAESPAPAASGKEPAKYKEVKEFGRLSSKAAPSGAKFSSETAGTMKTIGKLLLDVQAVENIIKSGETKKIGAGMTTAKIISAARGEGIKNILNTIDTYEGVAGSLIVGHDGLVIASTVGTGWDKDMLGALSTALLSTSNLATKKLEIGKLRQMVMLTELTNGDGQRFKTTVLTDVDVGILAVFLEKTDLQKIDGLLETIQSTIHGG